MDQSDAEEVFLACQKWAEQNETITIPKIRQLINQSFRGTSEDAELLKKAVTILRRASVPEEVITSLTSIFDKIVENELKFESIEIPPGQENLQKALQELAIVRAQYKKIAEEIANNPIFKLMINRREAINS